MVRQPSGEAAAAFVLGVLLGAAAAYSVAGSGAAGDDPAERALNGSTVWLDGELARVDGSTVFLATSEYADGLVRVDASEGGLFVCESNGDGGVTCDSVPSPSALPRGRRACVSVRATDDGLQVVKAFVDATCSLAPPPG